MILNDKVRIKFHKNCMVNHGNPIGYLIRKTRDPIREIGYPICKTGTPFGKPDTPVPNLENWVPHLGNRIPNPENMVPISGVWRWPIFSISAILGWNSKILNTLSLIICPSFFIRRKKYRKKNFIVPLNTLLVQLPIDYTLNAIAVQGGLGTDPMGTIHPFYLTSDAEGGYGTKSDYEARVSYKVYPVIWRFF